MLIYDLADPTELAGFVRNVPLPQFDLINTVMPGENIDDIDYRFTRGDLVDMDVATFRAFDAEAPIGTRPGLARVSGELPPISKKMRLGEEQRLRLRQLQRSEGNVAGIADQIFDDAGRLAVSVAGRLELAAGQSLDTGVLTINENGVLAQIDYGFTAEQKPVLTGGDLFSDPGADVLGSLALFVEQWTARNGGEVPGYFLTSKRVRNSMVRNTVLRNYVFGGTTNSGAMPMPVSRLNDVLGDFDLPPVRTYDTVLPVGGTSTRPIRDDRLIVMPAAAVGSTFYGVTAEALELVDARQIRADLAPGMVAVNYKTFDSVATWTKVAAIATPIIKNPSRVTSAKVL